MVDTLFPYLPQDRRRALSQGQDLPELTIGSALFADISGFTPLFVALVEKLGSQRAAEEMAHLVSQVYEALIGQIDQQQGSVIDFVGDAITCWFDADVTAERAATCALAMQREMAAFARVEVTSGVTAVLCIKIGIATGPARRFVIGDPALCQLDTLAGETIRQMSLAEGLAQKGEIVLAATAVTTLDKNATLLASRTHPESHTPFAILQAIQSPAPPIAPPSPSAPVSRESLRPWFLPPLYERLHTGQSEPLPEIRPVVALFLRFTGLDYDQDPAAGQKLDAFIRWVQQVTAVYEGYLLQLTIGDKGSFLYIAFGALTAHDDDAVRAVRTAQQLLHLPETLRFITLQIGIASGPARTGAYGSPTRRSFGAIGSDVVLAARLMVAAPPGEMRCAHSVYHQSRSKINFESLPLVRVKGRADLIRVYRPLAGDQRPLASHQPEMVGRQAEIALIEELLTAVQGGAFRLLIIEGEAGIGKSRLVAELVRQVRERGLTGLAGTGQSIETQTPYRAWRDVFISYFDLEEVSDVATEATSRRSARLETLAAQIIPTHMHRLPVFNDVLRLNIPENELTTALDARLRQQNVVLLVTHLLRAWTNQHPLILVLEDAHWLDALSWQLTLQVARAMSLANAPFLFVLVQRPLEGDTAVRHILTQLRALNGTQTLPLSTLPPDDITSLIANQLRLPASALPALLVALVQARANGNPFFAQELLINLTDAGLIQITGHACHLTGDLDLVRQTLPDTLHGLILARIDRLPPQRQFVMKVAAVIGRAFAVTPLHHVINQYQAMTTPLLREHLWALIQVDFTLLQTVEPDITYLFKHIITQEAAYQTLLFAQRRVLHRLVGEWYEKQFGDETTTVLPLLAYHYRYAEDVAKERHYLQLAGAAAKKIYANEAAIGFYTRWLVVTTPTASSFNEQINVYQQRGNLYECVGRWGEAEADYQAALTLAEQWQNPTAQGDALVALGSLWQQRGNFTAALSWLAQAQDIYLTVGDKKGRAQVLNQIGTVFWRQGEFTQAQALYTESLGLRRELGIKPDIASSLNNLGNVQYQQGNYAAARTLYEECLTLWQMLHDKVSMMTALNNLGNIHFHQGDYQAAQTFYQQALTLAHETGNMPLTALTLNALAILAMVQNNYSQAQRLYAESLSLARQLGDRWGVANRLDNLGRVLMAQGELLAAEALLAEGLAICREIGDKWGTSNVLRDLGMVRLGQGDAVGAHLLFEEALALSEVMGDRLNISHARRNLGWAHLQQGQTVAAQARIAESLALRRELGIQWGEASSLCDLGCVALAQGDEKAARALFGESLALCRKLADQSIGARALLGLALVDLTSDGPIDLAGVRGLMAESLQVRWKMGQKLSLTSNLLATAVFALRRNEADQAGRLLGAMGAILNALGGVVEVDVLSFYGPTVTAVQSALGVAAFDAARREGEQLTPEAAVNEVFGYLTI